MLEILRVAKAMSTLVPEAADDKDFFAHARAAFNQEFEEMNTDIHSLALFLHPLCKKLAVHASIKNRTFDGLCMTALGIAKKWNWTKQRATELVANLRLYFHGTLPFNGSHKDALTYWEGLTISADQYPLKTLAIILFRVVPHSADVERLFSNLGGIHGTKRCNLSVSTFEALGKLRSHYISKAKESRRLSGLPTRRKHAHMHTQSTPGINTETAIIVSDDPVADELCEAVLDTSDGTTELEQAFSSIEAALSEFGKEVDAAWRGGGIEAAKNYELAELESIEKGLLPAPLTKEVEIFAEGSGEGSAWNESDLLK